MIQKCSTPPRYGSVLTEAQKTTADERTNDQTGKTHGDGDGDDDDDGDDDVCLA